MKKLAESGGILGLSLYAHHLKDSTNCKLDSFCEMVARTVDIMGSKNVGIGSDLCLNQPDSIVEWMRNGTWAKAKNFGEGSKDKPGFPDQPDWFIDARGFNNIEKGLNKINLSTNQLFYELDKHWEVLGEAIQTVLRKYNVLEAYEKLKKLTQGQAINKELSDLPLINYLKNKFDNIYN